MSTGAVVTGVVELERLLELLNAYHLVELGLRDGLILMPASGAVKASRLKTREFRVRRARATAGVL